MPSRFFQKVVSLSRTPADFKHPQVVEAAAVIHKTSTVEDTTHTTVEDTAHITVEDTAHITVEDTTATTVEDTASATVVDAPAATVEDRPSSTVEAIRITAGKQLPSTVEAGLWRAEGANGIFTSSRVHRVVNAQDTLTHVEEAVYDVFWGTKKKAADGEDHRIVRIGYSELSDKSRVSKRTIQSIVDRLIEKAFIEIVEHADIYHRKATVYRVRSYSAAMVVQRAAGRTHVVRTGRGVFFARKVEAYVPSTVDAGLRSTVEARSPSTVAPPSLVTVEPRPPSTVELPSTTSLDRKKQTGGTSSSASVAIVVGERLRRLLTIDDDAVTKIVASCRETLPEATGDEIAHFAEIVIAKHSRNPKIDNLIGLMIRGAVAKYFEAPASELAALRAAKAEELLKSRELAREILANPDSNEMERKWANEALQS